MTFVRPVLGAPRAGYDVTAISDLMTAVESLEATVFIPDGITIVDGSVDFAAMVESFGAGATPGTYTSGDLAIAYRPSDGSAQIIPASSGGSSWTRQTKTANYTALITDDIIFCDASGGNFTITLAASASMTKPLHIVNVGATGTVTVDGNSTETINGSATAAIGPGSSLSLDAYAGNIRVF